MTTSTTPVGDPFRSDYGTLNDDQKAAMKDTKRAYASVWHILESLETQFGKSRDLSVARTELQTSCMWAVRACTKTGSQE